jgi:hypothetical protein
MSDVKTIVVDPPVGDADRLRQRCSALLDALGSMEMPIDELRIREAGGCVGGMLVEMMLSRSLAVPVAEAAAVADLCASLKDTFDDADDRSIIAFVHVQACAARDGGSDVEVTFR